VSCTTLLTKFAQLFNPYPGNQYLEVTSNPDETTKLLSELIQNVDGEFHLAIYDESEQDFQEQFPYAKIQHIKNFKQPFRALPRTHDIVVFKDIFHLHENQKGILKIAYTTLANTAHIIIMQKKGTMNIQAIKELLEEFEFRAANEIEIHPEYDLVMAKKMHMWGNGL
jgi:hypothetical protein